MEVFTNPTAWKFSGTVFKLFYSLIQSKTNFPHTKEMFKLLLLRVSEFLLTFHRNWALH